MNAKTLKFFMMLLCSVIFTMTFNSCKDDDDKVLSDPASKISGTYVGTGTLYDYYFGTTDETYAGMKMIVTKSSNEYVTVVPYLATGVPFFTNYSQAWQITQTASGEFILRNNDRPNATITIDKGAKTIDFYYPYVSVDDYPFYALRFNGTRQ